MHFKLSVEKKTLSKYKGHNTFMDLVECTWKTACGAAALK